VVYRSVNGKELLTLGHPGWVAGVAFSPDGGRLATGGSVPNGGASQVWVWNAVSGQEQLTLKQEHGGDVLGVVFSPDGRRLAAAGGLRVCIWDVADRLTLKGHTGRVANVVFSPDGRRLASWRYRGFDWTWRVWDAASGKELLTHTEHPSWMIKGVAFSPDGRRLVSWYHTGVWPPNNEINQAMVQVWDAVRGQKQLTLMRPMVSEVAFSPDGRRLAVWGPDKVVGHPPRGTVWVLDATSGKELLTILGDSSWKSEGVAFSPDGRRLASWSPDQGVLVWDTASGKELLALQVTAGEHPGVVFSPDGRRLASWSHDNTMRVWDMATGQELLTLKGVTQPLLRCGMKFSPDGRRLAWASSRVNDDQTVVEYTVRVWDTASGELLTLKGHTKEVRGVVFSPKGRRLVSWADDQTVRVWDTASGQELLTLKGLLTLELGDSGGGVAFSPDGMRLAAGGSDGMVRVW
jgi:WD40 repeat protein